MTRGTSRRRVAGARTGRGDKSRSCHTIPTRGTGRDEMRSWRRTRWGPTILGGLHHRYGFAGAGRAPTNNGRGRRVKSDGVFCGAHVDLWLRLGREPWQAGDEKRASRRISCVPPIRRSSGIPCPSPIGHPGAGRSPIRFWMAGRLDVVLTYWPTRASKRVVVDRADVGDQSPAGRRRDLRRSRPGLRRASRRRA
jgi:hypothetical protein